MGPNWDDERDYEDDLDRLCRDYAEADLESIQTYMDEEYSRDEYVSYGEYEED